MSDSQHRSDCQDRPRVLHILDPEPFGNVGGADLHVVDLATDQNLHGRFQPAVLLLTAAPMVEERLTAAGIEVLPGYALGRRYLELPLRLRSAMSRLAPDLLHSHGYDANYFACWARVHAPKYWARRPLLFTSHGWIDRPSLFFKTTLDLFTHRFADHIIICSPHQRQRARRAAGSDRITMIGNGVAVNRTSTDQSSHLREHFGVPPNSRLVGFIGRLAPEKRPDIFVEIARNLSARLSDVHFVMAGGGPLEEQIRRQIIDFNLTGRITMTGVLQDIDSLYQHLHILILPSITETTSRVTIEAMLWGIPVVASNVGGMPVLIEPGREGFLCPAGDSAAFTQCVEQLLTDFAMYAQMAERSRAKAQSRFTVEVMRAQVEKLYDDLLVRSTSRPSHNQL